MRLHLLHDSSGRILAAARLDAESKVPVPRPMAARGRQARATEIEVPAAYHGHDLPTICQTLRVDVKRKTLVPAKGKPTARSSARERRA